MLNSGMESQGPHNDEQFGLRLVELRLAALLIDKPLLEGDGNPIDVPDLLDHLIGRAPELSETALLGEGSVAALHQIALGEFLGLPHRVLHAGARNAAMVLIGYLG